jgi:hypothetical protein
MKSDTTQNLLEEHIDVLADIEHKRWSHWQNYMHSKARRQDDGTLVIPADLVKQWEKQAKTEYADLSDAEKESDREQVRNYIPAVSRIIDAQ